jgi:Na+-translocating ferredoxin:NAD+ oxidoreductase RnfD subunit
LGSCGISYLAVLVVAIGAFAFGSIYYGSLGEPWKKPAMIDPAEAKMSPVLFITGFIAELIMA